MGAMRGEDHSRMAGDPCTGECAHGRGCRSPRKTQGALQQQHRPARSMHHGEDIVLVNTDEPGRGRHEGDGGSSRPKSSGR